MIRGAIVRGITAVVVDVEIAFRPGPGFHIVGLGKTAVKESEDRLDTHSRRRASLGRAGV